MSCCRNILNVGRGLWLVLTLERKGSEREGFKEAAAMERSGNGLHSGMVVRGEGDGELVELEGGGGSGSEGALPTKSTNLEARSTMLVTKSMASLGL